MSGLHGTLLLEMVVIELRVSPKSSPNLSPWSSPEFRFYTYPYRVHNTHGAEINTRVKMTTSKLKILSLKASGENKDFMRII